MEFKSIDEFICESQIMIDAKQSKTYKDYEGMASLGLAMPAQQKIDFKKYFITINFSTNKKFSIRLNDKVQSIPWGMLKPIEQHRILSKVQHYLDYVSTEYSIYFEYTKAVNLHSHIIVKSLFDRKSIFIDLMRYFRIPHDNYAAIDIKDVVEEEKLMDYLTNKIVKTYQISPFQPIVKKPIDEFN